MSSSLRDIKRRIRSVANTQQIAKAMEMMAAARLKRYQGRLKHIQALERKMTKMVAVAQYPEFTHPWLAQPKEEGSLSLIFSSDRGLCGAYNGNIVRRFQQVDRNDLEWLWCIGKKAHSLIRFGHLFEGEMEVTSLPLRPSYEDVQEFFSKLAELYQQNRKAIYVLYTYPLSTTRLEIRWEKMFPAQLPETDDTLFLYEPDQPAAALHLFEGLQRMRFYRFFLCSQVSEYSARMLAMQAAGKNANELVDELTLSFNRARQAIITKEILEVVSGAEAQKTA